MRRPDRTGEDRAEIKEKEFYEMVSLEDLVMPKTITYIGESAFEKCKSLKTIRVYDTDPEAPEVENQSGLNLKYITEIGISAFS